MDYPEFQSWLAANTPPDLEQDEFLEYLAMMSAIILNEASSNTGRTVPELLQFSSRSGASFHDS